MPNIALQQETPLFAEVRGPRTWSMEVNPLFAGDVAIATAELPGLAGFTSLHFGVVAPDSWVGTDWPEVRLLAVSDGAQAECGVLLDSASTGSTTGVTAGYQTLQASVDLTAVSSVLPAARYVVSVQYDAGSVSGPGDVLKMSLVARLGGGGGGGGSGAGSQLIFSQQSAVFGPRLNGTHLVGATVLTLSATPAEMALFFVGQHVTIGLEQFRVTAVDAANFMITISEPGLANVNVNGPVRAGVMIGDGDTLQLPLADYKVLRLYFAYANVNSAGVQPTYTGYGNGGYAANDDDEVGSWLILINNFNYRWNYSQNDPADLEYFLALFPSTNQVTFNWGLVYTPATDLLHIEPLSAATDTRIPVLTELVIEGG